VTGALIWSFPTLVHSEGKGSTISLMFALAALFLSGIAFGYFEPKRYWRWAVASILLLPIIKIIALASHASNSTSSPGLFQSLPYLIVTMPVLALQGLPVLLGASLGAAIQNSGNQDFKIKLTKDQKIALLGALLGLLCCLLYFLLSSSYQSANHFTLLKLSGVLLCIVSACISFLAPHRVSRWALALGNGVVACVVFRILLNGILHPGSNNLFPIAIFFSSVFSYPFAFIGAYLGFYLKTGNNKMYKAFLIIAFILVATWQLLGPSLRKMQQEADFRQNSREFIFKVRHNSRGASINGNKLWLQFEANRFNIEDKKAWDNNQSVYVTFENDSLGFARILDVTKTRPDSSQYWVKTMAIRNSIDSSFLRINYPFSNFPIEEKHAHAVETDFVSKMKDSLSLITLKVFITENKFHVGDLSVDSLKFSDFVKKLDKK